MFVQMPDGLIVNFDHVMKFRKVDYVLDSGESKPILWLKYVTGEEERSDFDSRDQREAFYQELKSTLDIRRLGN